MAIFTNKDLTMFGFNKKTLLLTAILSTTIIINISADDVRLEAENPSIQTEKTPELEAANSIFAEQESLLCDLFKSLDEDEDEDLRSLPEPQVKFKYLNLLKEIIIFAHRENPHGVKLFLGTLAAGAGCSAYFFPKCTIGTLGTLVLADFIATRYANRKIK